MDSANYFGAAVAPDPFGYVPRQAPRSGNPHIVAIVVMGVLLLLAAAAAAFLYLYRRRRPAERQEEETQPTAAAAVEPVVKLAPPGDPNFMVA